MRNNMKEVPEPESSDELGDDKLEDKSSNDLIERATAAAIRLEAANKQLEKNLARQEALQVEKTLGGQAIVQPQKLDETPEEYKNRVMRGDFNTARN
jgi:hypothetical protein